MLGDKIKFRFKENRLATFMLCFGIVFLVSFFLLENRDVEIHIIHTAIDDLIPFCEVFIIPYIYWFIYMGGTFWYFLFKCENEVERTRVIYSLCLGMTMFLVVSFVYPNGHNLRPEFLSDNFWGYCVSLLYKVDTSTNVLPSLHVFETVVSSIGLMRQSNLRKYKGFSLLVWLSSILIITSTLLLKQHSAVDVISALGLNVICYILFYKINHVKRRDGIWIRKKSLRFRTY